MASKEQGRRTRRSFTEQYKAEVVALCRGSEKPISEIARDLDLTESVVRRWAAQAEVDAGRREGLTADSSHLGHRFRCKPITDSRQAISIGAKRRWLCAFVTE